MARWVALYILALAVAGAQAAYDGPVVDRYKDGNSDLSQALSKVFLAKEQTPDGAQHALKVFHSVTREHILSNDFEAQAKGKTFPSKPSSYQTAPPAKISLPAEIIALLGNLIQPIVSYLSESPTTKLSGLIPNATAIESHGDPNLAYFVDPTQNPVLDFFKFASKNFTSLGTVSGPDFLDYAPCWVSNAPTGVYLSAAAINFVPALLSVNPVGIYIQPSIIYISPYGLQFTPTAINIAPSLISIIPIQHNVAPQGVNIAPDLISDTGRKLLQNKAATNDQPQSQQDIFLASYSNWAVTLANMLNLKAGGVPSQAAQILDAVVEEVGSNINDLATGNLTDLLPAPVSFSDPSFFSDLSANISSTSKGFSLSSAFLNYMPCVVSNFPAGVQITASGINFSPTGVFINPAGIESQASAINIMPTVIWVSPEGTDIVPTALNIVPTLISIAPTSTNVNPQGENVNPSGISIDSSGSVTFGGSR